MTRYYQNFLSGTLSAGISATSSVIDSSGLSAMSAVSTPHLQYVILDPGGVSGAPEVVHVVAHSTSATAATVLRGQESSVARTHNSATPWVAAVTAADFQRFDLIEAASWVSSAKIADGAVTAAKLAASAVVAGKLAAGAVNAANLFAADVVDAAAIAAGAVGTSEIADTAVTTAKIVDGAVTSAKLSLSAGITQGQLAVLPTGRWTSGSVSLIGGTFTTLTWTAETEDDLNSATPSFSSWTAPAAGLYVFQAAIVPAASPTAAGQIAAVVNATVMYANPLINTGSQQGGTWSLVLGTGDAVYIAVSVPSTITNNSGTLRIVRTGLV